MHKAPTFGGLGEAIGMQPTPPFFPFLFEEADIQNRTGNMSLLVESIFHCTKTWEAINSY